jgi:hypothetical protein
MSRDVFKVFHGRVIQYTESGENKTIMYNNGTLQTNLKALQFWRNPEIARLGYCIIMFFRVFLSFYSLIFYELLKEETDSDWKRRMLKTQDTYPEDAVLWLSDPNAALSVMCIARKILLCVDVYTPNDGIGIDEDNLQLLRADVETCIKLCLLRINSEKIEFALTALTFAQPVSVPVPEKTAAAPMKKARVESTGVVQAPAPESSASLTPDADPLDDALWYRYDDWYNA